MIRKVSEFHDHLAQAVAPFRGKELTQADILKAYADAFPQRPDDLKWIQGSDHSSNHTNRGPCVCSGTASALFQRVGHGKYRVL